MGVQGKRNEISEPATESKYLQQNQTTIGVVFRESSGAVRQGPPWACRRVRLSVGLTWKVELSSQAGFGLRGICFWLVERKQMPRFARHDNSGSGPARIFLRPEPALSLSKD